MFVRKIVQTLCGVVLLGVLATSATGAMDLGRTTYFTFSGTVQMPGVALPAGTYVFEVVNPNTGGDVVVVRSRDRKKVHLMRLTRFVYRPQRGTLDSIVSLGESAAGRPPTVKAWYPQGDTRGHEFIY